MKKRLNVLVLCGGPSSEREVSIKTAEMVLKNLDKTKYAASLGAIGKDGKWRLGSRSVPIGEALKIITSKFDFVFIAMHGAFGEDGRLQAILESINIPYSGSGVLSSAMAMDKGVSNMLYSSVGLNVPEYAVLDKKTPDKNIKFSFPAVVKPADGGSSVGISIVRAKKDFRAAFKKAFKESGRVMVQKYIKGKEFTCGIIEGKDGKLFPLPPTEIIPQSSAFFDYKAKYEKGGSIEITPARLSKEKTKEIQKLAMVAHQSLGCSGMSRSDFILNNSKFYILETNTIPGMTETSLLPQAAAAAGINFSALLDMMISAGLRTGKSR